MPTLVSFRHLPPVFSNARRSRGAFYPLRSPFLENATAGADAGGKPAPILATSAAMNSIFLTVDQAAQLLHVSKQTIRQRIRDGELPAKRLRGGQTVLIDQKDVLALLEDIVPGTDI